MSETTILPVTTEQHIAQAIAAYYDLEGTLERLDGYADRNFRLTLSDGTRYLAKLSQASATQAEAALMVALEDAPLEGLELPRHRRSCDGQAVVTITLDGERWQLRLLSYLDGTLWAAALPPSEAQLYALGERLGRLDQALAALDIAWPPGNAPDWDLSTYRTLLERPERSRLEREMHEQLPLCIDFVRAREHRLPTQLIHNDANDYNVFLRGPASEDPCGLIDFGDACHGFAVAELAVAAVYLTDRGADRLEVLKQLTLGYHGVRPLSVVELECLPRLILLRILLSRLNYLKAQAAGADDPYIAISQAQLLRQWRLFTTLGPELIAEELIAACHPEHGLAPLPERRTLLAKGGILAVAGDTAALASSHAFGVTLAGDAGRVATAETFQAERDLVLHNTIRVTRVEQREDRLSIGLRDPRLGRLSLTLRSADPEVPLPTAELSMEGFALPLAAGQAVTLTCLWGEDDTGGLRQRTSLSADDWSPVAEAYLDPNLALGRGRLYGGHHGVATLLEARRRLLSPTLSHAYHHPLKIVRGEMAYLISEDGRRYLDLVNNVCHVGHANPRVVEAGARQMAELNTNTRYLHDTIVAYSERLLATLPEHLEVVFLVNSGSEANDLAMRLARTYTGRHDLAVLDHAYHGHLSSLIDISPYKHDGPGGQGTPEHVIKLPFPDTYRGRHRGEGAAERYLAEALDTLSQAREQPAAFYAESFAGVGGQWIWPASYLEGVTRHLQAHGTLYIADEVQVGFGRAGSSFWAFEQYDVRPDIVTLGKPIGNGHPIAAVVTTRAVAEAFQTGMEYFNTFSGNPVSCAIALAVLDEIESRDLQCHARVLGDQLKTRLEVLAERFSRVGQVRGRGLFIGVEIIQGSSLAPDRATAKRICHFLRLNGVLLSTDGPDDNVLKIKPPLAIQAGDIDDFLKLLEASFDLYCH
ncbi:aminotransferase class III-fold pyridoxal phosphate-dependent enzyme [Halomonas sp. NCCP-2165]|nr:aminotransferase class III-fold pyridoxal phosphate-dependent enzyme [Halomonas sp. NCCP-2165]GKW47798.1 hypothetical protein NCCP2165_00130 [Halomonas sp. NCCP-2165]